MPKIDFKYIAFKFARDFLVALAGATAWTGAESPELAAVFLAVKFAVATALYRLGRDVAKSGDSE